MYVAYNRFYPPDLGHLESRNATPDRSHNETFDALVTTGLIGFIAENLLFLTVFYFALKWLGFIRTSRERNAFAALWYLTGLAVALVFGAIMGWQFIGVALPAGMILGFFIYLVGFTLLRGGEMQAELDPTRALLLVTLVSVIVAHFVEIHFGIAIVSTRTYFWFVAALLVVVGTKSVAEFADVSNPAQMAPPEPVVNAPVRTPTHRKKGRRAERRAAAEPARESGPRVRPGEISTAPIIAFAFLTGLILATMGFNNITINSIGSSSFPVDIVIAALTTKATTGGVLSSNAMFWLFAGTLLVALSISLAEWGSNVTLKASEWLLAGGLSFALSIAVFSIFIIFHTFLISAPGAEAVDATLSAFSLFVVFVLVMVTVVGIAFLFDNRLPSLNVVRLTTGVVAAVLAGFALIFIMLPDVSTSAVSIVQADILYKDALALATGTTLPQSIDRFKQALERQPDQDYYSLFLGRSYLECAKTFSECAKTLEKPATRDQVMNEAETALLRARDINPLQTDHTANLARLHQAWAPLVSDPSARIQQYKDSLAYYSAAIRLSPNTVQLYDQFAQDELEYAAFLKVQNQVDAAAEVVRAAQDQLKQSLTIDPGFCLSYAVRAQSQSDWSAEARDALDALKYAPTCGDVFVQDGRAGAMQALFEAGDRAVAAGASGQYATLLENEANSNPTVELYTALTNFYSTAGQIEQALQAADAAIGLIPASDSTTLKKYQDFRSSLVGLQQEINSANTTPGDPEAHRNLAKGWLARGQFEFALPEYRHVLKLLPNDYDANRMVSLLLVQRDQFTDAWSTITATLALAPAIDRPFWKQLGAILEAAQKGQNDTALAALEALTESVDPKDNVTLQALHELSTKLKGNG